MSEQNIAGLVDRLKRQGKDDSEYEVKECSHSLSKDVWESVSAFANTAGGTLILGMSERRGFAPVEHFEIDKVRDQFLSGMGDGGSPGRITNPPHYDISRSELDGSPLLVIAIDELGLSHKPCYITARGVQGGSFKRVDDADIPLSANEIYSLQTAAVITATDRVPVSGADVSDLDDALVERTFERARVISPRALSNAKSTATQLARLNFTTPEGLVTKAGLFSAGIYPQQFYPKLCVDVAVHAGVTKGGVGGQRFLDRTVCDGPIGEMIEASVLAVAKNLRRVSTVQGLGREDDLEIPVEILREAIANALIHRDYDQRFDGQAVSVDVFDDRVEVINPGGLWGKSRDNIADGTSCCRNPTLMRLMSLVPLPDAAGSPAEGNGSGIPFMLQESRIRGLEDPEFYPSFDHFKIVLHRPQTAAKAGGATSPAPKDDSLIWSLLYRDGEMSSRELSEASGLTLNQVRSRIKRLLAAGRVEATAPPTSRKRKYRAIQ